MIMVAMVMTAVALCVVTVRCTAMRVTVSCFRKLRLVAVLMSVMRYSQSGNKLVRFRNVGR